MHDKATREAFLFYIDGLGQRWRGVFNRNSQAYVGSAYWNLFISLWKEPSPVKIADAGLYMPEVRSVSGSKSYIDRAIEDGYLVTSGKDDSRLIALSDEFRGRIDDFIDDCIVSFLISSKKLERISPPPHSSNQ